MGPHRGRVRVRGSSSNLTPTSSRGRGRGVQPPGRGRGRSDRDGRLSPGACAVVHFDVPVADGREIISVSRLGRRSRIDYSNRCLLSGPVILVAAGTDGMYFTDYGVPRGRFKSIDQLIHAFGAHWPSPCTDPAPCEEQQHVGSSASAQALVPDGLQQLAFPGLLCKEEHVSEPASAQTLQEPDATSLKELLDSTTLEESSNNATSLSSLQDIIDSSPPSGRCLSSSPIWVRKEPDWGFTFHTVKDLRGFFRTYPHVGGPFQSLDEAYKAIDRYLGDHRDPTMGMEPSLLDRVVRQCLCYLDGTRKKRQRGVPIDERRDKMRQLVKALVDKYNDYHNLLGDFAYELKDVVRDRSIWELCNSRFYYHINFTAKTKGSDDSGTGSDNLFFAEVTFMTGKHEELVVNCCCMIKPFDNGHCYCCEKDMKHPNDVDAYTGGHLEGTRDFPFGGPKMCWSDDEDFEAEEARLRFLYQGLDNEVELQASLPPCEV